MQFDSGEDGGDGRRRTLIVIDDNRDVLDIYKRVLTEHFGERYSYYFFDNSARATEFVTQNKAQILGYVQDINRLTATGALAREGVSFFNKIIDNITPWAKCLIISAYFTTLTASELSAAGGEKIRLLSKIDIGRPEQLKPNLDWLVTPYSPHSDAPRLPPSANVATLIAPAWNELCRYIVTHQNYLHTMDPRNFEMLAGEMFRSFGWDVELTSRTRDGGYDIIAVRQLGFSNLRVLVEAKRFNPQRPVGVDLIRQLYGVKQFNAASQLVLVTSSYVTLDARKQFERVVPWELDFVERDRILEWCRERSRVTIEGTFG